MQKYTYTIVSVDTAQHTMVVKYTPDDLALSEYSFNITAPDDMANLTTHINGYAPQDKWFTELNPNLNLANIIGQTGNIDPASYSTTNVIDVVEFNSVSGDQSVIEGFAVIPANAVTL